MLPEASELRSKSVDDLTSIKEEDSNYLTKAQIKELIKKEPNVVKLQQIDKFKYFKKT